MTLTIVGGYLGAGKTTLINQRLRTARGKRIAVLVNDFGEVNVDGELVESRDDDVLRLTGGCICCSFGADLVGCLRRVLAQQPPYDEVLIEASGVALPSAIARTIDLFVGRAATTLVVVDASRVYSLVDDRYVGDTVRRQLQEADELVLTHLEALDAAGVTELREWLESCVGQPVPVRAVPAEERFARSSVEIREAIDVAALGAALATLDPPIERAKAVLRDVGGALLVLQVMRDRYRVEPCPVGATPTALVCIGLRDRFDPTAIESVVERQLAGDAATTSVGRALVQ